MCVSVSNAEWEVMRFLWDHPDSSAADVVQGVQQARAWKPTTIRTLINRLVKKQVVRFRPEIGGYRYTAIVSETESVAAERRSFLQKVYGGNPKPMLVALLSDEALTPNDIEDLKRLLEDRT